MTGSHPRDLLRHPVHFLSLGFGSGLVPKAPGTAGTLTAIPVYYLCAVLLTDMGYVLVTLFACLLGIYLCGQTTRSLGVKDHPAIVWDEFCGFMITMLFVPPSFINVLAGFILFRVFDITKPWPVSVIDSRMHGGLGVMLDDIVAGLYALVLLQILVHYIIG